MGRLNVLVLVVLVAIVGGIFAAPAHAQTETPTPTATPTATPSPTPPPTPTATALPTVAVGTYFVTLPSGGVGAVKMEITAGDAMTTAAIMVLTVISVFRVLQQLSQAGKASG